MEEQVDARDAVSYLVVPESAQHIAIMEVLEASITDLAPRDVMVRLSATGMRIDESVVEARLEQLREWGAVSKRSDTTRLLRAADLLAKNWRYTATPIGRHVQRFYRKVLAGAKIVREIPLASLARLVDAAESIAASGSTPAAEQIGLLFISHDDLDGALVGAEDTLATLVDRFDLDPDATAELKTLLVNYATHIAVELERGASRAYRALITMRSRFPELAGIAVAKSDARDLIERGALNAARGGRTSDWEDLLAWCDPDHGRAARFAMRLVRALPGMHINLRRLHSSSGTATSRGRLLTLAKASLDPVYGPSVFLAAVGDHPWRKLYGAAEDEDLAGVAAWRDGPSVEVPELLRLTGRGGARGRASPARDDTAARAAVALERDRRARMHAEAIDEVLSATSGAPLSEHAARVALATLMVAIRAHPVDGQRTGTYRGLACTLVPSPARDGRICAPAWYVIVPGRAVEFHRPHVASSSQSVRIAGGAT